MDISLVNMASIWDSVECILCTSSFRDDMLHIFDTVNSTWILDIYFSSMTLLFVYFVSNCCQTAW